MPDIKPITTIDQETKEEVKSLKLVDLQNEFALLEQAYPHDFSLAAIPSLQVMIEALLSANSALRTKYNYMKELVNSFDDGNK